MKRLVYIIFFLVLGLVSCKKGHELDCFKSNGKETKQERSLSTFEFIAIEGKVDVIVEEGNEFKVIVSGGEHLIKNITTKVIGNTLYINNTSKCHMVRGYKRRYSVKVILPKLKYLENKGSNNVYVYNGLAKDSLTLSLASPGSVYVYGDFEELTTGSHGNGDVYAYGSTKRLNVFMSGNNFFYGEGIKITQLAFVESFSLGHCHLLLENTPLFEYRLWSKGNIYYTGNPQSSINYTNEGVKGKAIKKQ
jgi:hypothetical protein